MTAVDMANKFEAHVISMMDQSTYEWYMSLPRENRADLVFSAMKEASAALK